MDYPGYFEDKGRFFSEFGWQAPPTLDLLTEYLDSMKMKLIIRRLKPMRNRLKGSTYIC